MPTRPGGVPFPSAGTGVAELGRTPATRVSAPLGETGRGLRVASPTAGITGPCVRTRPPSGCSGRPTGSSPSRCSRRRGCRGRRRLGRAPPRSAPDVLPSGVPVRPERDRDHAEGHRHEHPSPTPYRVGVERRQNDRRDRHRTDHHRQGAVREDPPAQPVHAAGSERCGRFGREHRQASRLTRGRAPTCAFNLGSSSDNGLRPTACAASRHCRRS